ncbi:hypothetical protein M3O96_00495 [Aquiflexum sp. TKW24L]|uniref:hypothetical protein n=1 Tax=Aquiflexum sp. TKW24L TaxID=2942212 RepID=UPI0020BE622D|nr:hypothetical protein [Aquiflexum sp. TKW24L]MCL6257547.1 hypothetical protein [Aquiflexum sp. TKW24L]
MEENLKESLLAICSSLSKHKVDYLIVGGIAVALHGFFRISRNQSGQIMDKPDIDIWFDPTYSNYFNVLKVMKELGQDITEIEKEKTPHPRESFFKIEFESFYLDFLPEIKSKIKFSDAHQRKERILFEEIPIDLIHYSDLIFDKETSARKKDLEDIEQLRKLKGDK